MMVFCDKKRVKTVGYVPTASYQGMWGAEIESELNEAK
jgi:hypothetical protein